MSLTLLAWCCLFFALAVLSLRRPVWAVGLYYLTYFAAPSLWWWGKPIAGQRWSLLAGSILLAASVLSGKARVRLSGRAPWWPCMFAVLMFVNASLVHLFLAPNPESSLEAYSLLAKFTLLFLILVAVVNESQDFRIVVLVLVFGLAYLGYELAINERGSGRLDGVGCPGAMGNGLANVVAALLPVSGWLLFSPRKWEKLLGAFSTITAVEILGRCNSRAAFLALIASAFVTAILATGRLRRKVFVGFLLGALALSSLIARNPQVLARFETTFADEEERDRSAASRPVLWRCGWRMVADYPFGSGGDAFKYTARGVEYKEEFFQWADFAESAPESKAVHNGYINEAIQWGVQGLVLKLLFVAFSALYAYKALRLQQESGNDYSALCGVCLLASTAALVVKAMTGDSLDFEGVYWIGGACVAYAKVYGSIGECTGRVAGPSASKTAWSHAMQGERPFRAVD